MARQLFEKTRIKSGEPATPEKKVSERFLRKIKFDSLNEAQRADLESFLAMPMREGQPAVDLDHPSVPMIPGDTIGNLSHALRMPASDERNDIFQEVRTEWASAIDRWQKEKYGV